MPFHLTTLDAEGIQEEVKEGGSSFEENASLKARGYAAVSGLLTLADDSGLEVDALAGEPGVRSARYAGEDASDEELVRFLLSRMEGVPPGRRGARFRCVIALAWPGGRTVLAEGVREGMIALEPKGANGFGYDPVFYLPEHRKTMAELTGEEKNRVSHRAMAAHKVAELLHGLAKRREKEEI